MNDYVRVGDMSSNSYHDILHFLSEAFDVF